MHSLTYYSQGMRRISKEVLSPPIVLVIVLSLCWMFYVQLPIDVLSSVTHRLKQSGRQRIADKYNLVQKWTKTLISKKCTFLPFWDRCNDRFSSVALGVIAQNLHEYLLGVGFVTSCPNPRLLKLATSVEVETILL